MNECWGWLADSKHPTAFLCDFLLIKLDASVAITGTGRYELRDRGMKILGCALAVVSHRSLGAFLTPTRHFAYISRSDLDERKSSISINRKFMTKQQSFGAAVLWFPSESDHSFPRRRPISTKFIAKQSDQREITEEKPLRFKSFKARETDKHDIAKVRRFKPSMVPRWEAEADCVDERVWQRQRVADQSVPQPSGVKDAQFSNLWSGLHLSFHPHLCLFTSLHDHRR